MVLDHDSGPIFTGLWVVIALLLVYPFYGDLLRQGIENIIGDYSLILLLIFKGCVLWILFYNAQVLTEKSLSATKFSLPVALGFIAIVNSFLGESLEIKEWIAAFSLCALGIIFSLRGHLQELGISGRILFFKLVLISIVAATLDFLILSETNWYVLLLVTNITMIFISAVRGTSINIWKSALFRKEAIFAGSVFSIVELVKFYLMVSILPMTVVISAQVAIIPIILVLSAVIWGERGWKEQLIWGILSSGLLLLLFI